MEGRPDLRVKRGSYVHLLVRRGQINLQLHISRYIAQVLRSLAHERVMLSTSSCNDHNAFCVTSKTILHSAPPDGNSVFNGSSSSTHDEALHARTGLHEQNSFELESMRTSDTRGSIFCRNVICLFLYCQHLGGGIAPKHGATRLDLVPHLSVGIF